MFYKDIFNFGKYIKDDKTIINDSLEYKISDNDSGNYNMAEIDSKCNNPITLCYINNNIKKDYSPLDNSLVFDGSILDKCNIPLSSINNSVTFTITITNHLDEKYKTNIYFDIPLNSASKTIYDGYFTKELKQENLFKFLHIQ